MSIAAAIASRTRSAMGTTMPTGVELLTGFLLTLPFRQLFDILGAGMQAVHLATVGCAMVATVLLIAPVAMHRLLFRLRRLATLVSAAHRCADAGVVLLDVALGGVSVVIFAAVLVAARLNRRELSVLGGRPHTTP